ncbi:MAG: type III-A CRISPR-associated RAMP protein Csm5 [Calditrichaeota bacterium]|nr:MAG: type III-A CRISPR-associated RAMP protein Csm5 [Calditrichota bacterium]
MTHLYFKTISPLHIGTGKVLEPFDYVFYQEKVIILDQEACLERMFEKHPQAVDRYVEWIQQTVQRMNNAKNEARNARRDRDRSRAQHHNQILSELRKNFNLVYFCENELSDSALAKEILSNSQYHKNAIYALDRPAGTRQLREMIHINGQPYVPGSSLKGAIRTALAYRATKNLSDESLDILLNGKSGTNLLGIKEPLQRIREFSQKAIIAIEKGNEQEINQALKALQNERRYRIQKKKIGDEVEKVVFGCGDGGVKEVEKFDDPKFDLLRLIKISDSIEGEWGLLAGHLMSFTRNNRTGQLSAQPIQYCQFIDEGSIFSVSLEIDTQLIGAILNNRVKGWTSFERKFRTLFNTDPHLPPEQLEQEIVKNILEAIREFGWAILEKEKDWLNQFNDNEIKKLHEFYDNLPQDATLLRVGFSSGWHSTTVGLALAENPALSGYLPEIIYAFNLDLIQKQENLLRLSAGQIVENRNRKKKKRDKAKELKQIETITKLQIKLLERSVSYSSFPRSRRLIAEGRKPYAPVGWLEVSTSAFQKSDNPSKSAEKKSKETIQVQNGNQESFEERLKKLKKKFGK